MRLCKSIEMFSTVLTKRGLASYGIIGLAHDGTEYFIIPKKSWRVTDQNLCFIFRFSKCILATLSPGIATFLISHEIQSRFVIYRTYKLNNRFKPLGTDCRYHLPPSILSYLIPTPSKKSSSRSNILVI